MPREDILYQFVSFPLFFCHQEWYWYSVTRDNIISISPASDLYSQMTLQWGRSKKKIRTETICRSLARGHKLQFTRETCNYSCNNTLTKDGVMCHLLCTVQLSSSESPHLLNPPIEDALIEDLGRGRGPDCPDEFVSVGVWPRPGAGDHWLVRATWNIGADDEMLFWWLQTTPVIRTESVLVPRLFLATQE